MSANRGPKVVDPITFEYVTGILHIIQGRSKAERSFNAHQQGSKGQKQRDECKKFKVAFASSKMSEDTLKGWFKTMYEMVTDIFYETEKKSQLNFALKNCPLTPEEKSKVVIEFIQRGLDKPDPKIGI